MPKKGYYDIEYVNKLKDIGITLLEPFVGSKKHHQLECDNCKHQWSATPISKLQAYKKWKMNGCPNCRDDKRYCEIRDKIIQQLKNRNIEVLSNYRSLSQTHNKLIFKNNNCGHTFDAYPGNVLYRGVDCPTCGIELRSEQLTKTSKNRSIEYQKTASAWNKYRHKVYALTRQAYSTHKSLINPNNLFRGKAGVENAHHLDHIVPVRYCFNNNIPEEMCAHQDNLQMLHWRANVGSRDKIKNHLPIPKILQEYVVTT